MNILLLTPSYFPFHGGTEQVIYDLALKLMRDNTVLILTIRYNKNLPPFEILNGIKVYRANYFQINHINILSKYVHLFFTALKLHCLYKIDIIHMFHVFEVGGAAYLLRKLCNIPLLTTLAGWDTFSPIKNIPKRHIFIIKTILNSSDIITAPSKHLALSGKKQGCTKPIHVIPHGTSINNQKHKTDSSIVDTYTLRNKKIVLSVQRLHPVKGLSYLLAAIPYVLKKFPQVIFLILGKGREEDKLKDLAATLKISKQVLFVGFIQPENLPSFYASADLFVLPSLYESFGLVYIDAIRFGLPIVTTENGGSLDIINKRNGIIVPPKDSVKLSHAIIEALQKNWDRNKIKIESEKYLWGNIIKEYQSLYDHLSPY